MPKLTRRERDDILQLIQTEEATLLEKASEVAGAEWQAAESLLAERLGFSDNLTKAEHLREQIQEAQRELNELEKSHPWRSIEPSDREFQDANLQAPPRDRWGALLEYSTPSVFGVKLNTKWNLEVFKIVNERMNILQVQKILRQTGQSIRREITLSGTFEDVRQSYQRFYELLRRAGGDEVPPLLNQIIEMPPLLPSAGKEKAD